MGPTTRNAQIGEFMKSRTLITGFGPYARVPDNPSARIAESLDYPHEVIEVSFDAVEHFLHGLEPDTFDRLLMLGVDPGSESLCPELFARNFSGASPDVTGTKRFGPIDPGQPLLLTSTLFRAEPLSEILLEIPGTHLSLDAGNYVCNFAYFEALVAFPDKEIGLLHLPTFDRMPFELQVSAIGEVLHALDEAA